MESPQLEVAEVFRKHQATFLERFGASLPTCVHKAINAIIRCRTKALGGHILECDGCGKREQSYNSCRNRACPKCEGSKQAKWVEERAKDLLPVHYFHVVFTLPHTLNHLILLNQKACYGLFFQAVQKTLLKIGKSKLKAKIGFFSILHTWGQQLDFHPHLHCCVPGGGIALDKTSWIHSSKKHPFFVSTKVLSPVFRGMFIQGLKRLYEQNKLTLPAQTNFESLLNEACKKDWLVYCKPPFAGALAVLKYLARYTHRIAISNSRLVEISDTTVTFRWKDYRENASIKHTTLAALEFMRRFLMHVLPPGFVRIRHCGFLANSKRKKNLELIRTFLKDTETCPLPEITAEADQARRCPHCEEGMLIIIATLLPERFPFAALPPEDSS